MFCLSKGRHPKKRLDQCRTAKRLGIGPGCGITLQNNNVLGKNKKRVKKLNIQDILREREKIYAFLEENGPFSNNPEVLEDYQKHVDERVIDTVTMRGDKEGLDSLLAFHLEQMNLINVTEIRRDRLKMVLDEAKNWRTNI